MSHLMEKDYVATDLSCYDNSWYHPGRGALVRSLWFLFNALFLINPLNPSSGIKVRLLRLFGARIARGVVIKPGVNVKYPWNLEVGAHSWIGEKVWLDSLAPIKIGAHCCLSQGVVIMTGNHNYKQPSFDLLVKEVVLEDGVWLGAGSMLAPGTCCRSHSVLSLLSVASGELEAYSVYRGNPALKVRERRAKN